ncbi:MAG: PD-(D/E)XK nuclease family protein, partial [bacterium]|nr:PD-(D/E)XK nuclease family protein [bacterium]
MRFLKNKTQLFKLLASGATVVTPNNRLSAALLHQYFTFSNEHTVDKPKCLPYKTLMIQTYNQLQLLKPERHFPNLLNDHQCRFLWQKIIRETAEITFSKGLLESVMQAWEHCQQWQIAPENLEFTYTPQTRQFQLWWQAFNQQIQRLGVITEYQLLPYLLENHHALFTQ